MTNRSRKAPKQPPRRVSVRAVRRAQPDSKRLSRALVSFALQQAADEAAAQAEAEGRTQERGDA